MQGALGATQGLWVSCGGGGQWGLEGSEVHPSLGFRKGTGVALRGAGGLPIWASLG